MTTQFELVKMILTRFFTKHTSLTKSQIED